jgi:hypothetical protein
MKRLAMVVTLAAGLGASGLVFGTTWTDWADEFVSAQVLCRGDDGDVDCYYLHHWKDGINLPRRWSYVGAQWATAAGRAQAVEEVYTSWHEATTTCAGMTVNLARRRTATVPALDSACTAGSQTFVGSVSYTKNSCVFENSDWDLSHRLLPAYDFTQETAGHDVNIGYRSTVSVSCTSGGCDSSTFSGCFKIWWR